jgi:integrase
MANIRERLGKRGKRSFYVQVRINGFPARHECFPTRRMAERWAKTVEAEMIEGRAFRSVEARRRTLADAIDRYVDEEAPKKRDASTRVSRLLWWKDKLGHLKLADITSAVIVEYRGKLKRETYTRAKPGAKGSTLKAGQEPRQLKRGDSTVNRYLAYLSHVFTIARKEWHWLTHDPFDGVSKFKEPKGRVRFLTEEERTRLLAETSRDPQLHTLVILALATAARAGELLKLTWQDVELEEGRASLWYTKNDEARSTWLHGEARRLLAEQRQRQGGEPDPQRRVFAREDGGPYDYRDPFTEACARANVTKFPFHCLRHSAATYLARLGATEQQLKAIGGWKSNVVSRYVHLAAKDARAIQEQMTNRIFGDAEADAQK